MNSPVDKGLFSFLIVNYKSWALTLECVRSIARECHAHRYEIIIVDNHSERPETGEGLEEANPYARLVHNPYNNGFGAGNNLAAQNARGEYLILINPDIILVSDIIAEFSRHLETLPNRVILGGNLLTMEQTPASSYGHLPTLLGEVLRATCVTRVVKMLEPRFSEVLTVSPEATNPFRVEFVCGALVLIRRVHFEELEGFDEDIFLYCEEADLMDRFEARSGQIYVIPTARAIHNESSVVGSASLTQIVELERGRRIYYRKRHGGLAMAVIKYCRIAIAYQKYLFYKNKNYLKAAELWKGR